MPLTNAAAAFIGASVTLVLVIIFMILMVILVRQCLAFIAKRNSLRQQAEQQLRVRQEMERQRRGSITEPVPATFDWHHSIRIAGTPPPTYHEAKGLPKFDESPSGRKKKRLRRNKSGDNNPSNPVILDRSRSFSEGQQNSNGQSHPPSDNRERSHTIPSLDPPREQQEHEDTAIAMENERNSEMMSSEAAAAQEETVSNTTANGSVEVISNPNRAESSIEIEMEQSG